MDTLNAMILRQFAQCYAYGNQTLFGDHDPRFLHTGDAIRARGYLTVGELFEIAHWKSPRRAGLTKKNPPEVVKGVTGLALALKDDHPGYAANLLAVLRGVLLPTASAVLTVVDPQRFGIIDIRAWNALSRWQPEQFPRKEQGTFTINEFMRYLDTIRQLAQDSALSSDSALSCREVDMALWQIDAST
ncbi:MAG: hypothetical protein JW934_15130 [Anaerolineae bacterium]|nr:hypothetical protein [Anaerolineae bacterium]